MTTKKGATSIGAVCALLLQSPTLAAGDSDLIFFLSADGFERQSISLATLDEQKFTVTADVLYSYENGPWRVLGEYFLTDEESDLERLQFGYDFSTDSTIWLGRFHRPISVWNHQFHHGAYLQPSISRPAIENWEDQGGVLPGHVTGVLIDSLKPVGDKGGIRFAASAGFGPGLAEGELLPFDILHPGDGPQQPAASVNLAYLPDYAAESSFGLVAGYVEIEADPMPALGLATSFEIQQSTFGAHANWETDDWQLISAVYYIDNDVRQSVAAGGWFVAGYVQAQHQLGENTAAYLRLENTRNADSADYLKIFPEFIQQRELLGFRYDFAKRQAIALEISRNEVSMDSYSQIHLQWSAVFQ
jgi:hypothetical protein